MKAIRENGSYLEDLTYYYEIRQLANIRLVYEARVFNSSSSRSYTFAI